MAREVAVLFLVFLAAVGLASAAIDPHGSIALAAAPMGDGNDNVIGTTDGSSPDAAPVGGPVPAGAFSNESPAESPKGGATAVGATSAASVIAAAAVAGFFFF